MTRTIWNTLAALAVLIVTALPLSAAEVVTYYHNDHLGSPIAATDDTGSVVWQQAYDPWGFKLTANTDERGYTGNWLDEETGLADHKARWYTSSIGRFTGIDPVKWQESNIHSFNRYAYASNNPYAFVDRDGRNAVTFVGGVIVESINALRGKGFNGDRVLGALADGYNGEGAGFARSLYQDVETFVPIGAVAGALVKSSKLAKTAATKGFDKWSRTPKSIQDKMALEAAKEGQGNVIVKSLNDPQFRGMEKIELKVKSAKGNDSVVHYVRDPKTGNRMDFKFKKHSTDG